MLLEKLKKIDWFLLCPALFLSLFGLLSIYSSSLPRGSFFDFKKQALYIGLSFVFCLTLAFLDLRFLKSNGKLIFVFYIFALLSLLLLLFFGANIRGVKGWYRIGPFSFDPEPLATIVLIIVLAKYFSARHIDLKRFSTVVISAVYVLLAVLFVLFQPDLGSALVLVAVWLGVVVFSGASLKNILLLFLIGCLLFGLAWQFCFQDYHKARFFSFLNPSFDKQGVSWSVNQSKIAIGNGGLFGAGFGQGSQTQLGFLSEPKTDFIFSAIAEEFGFIGVLVLISTLLFLFYRVLQTAFLAKNNFLRIFALGFAFFLLSQSFINIAMCLGLFPVIGIPLPFISYGGSTMLGFYAGLGVLISLRKH